MNIIPGSLALLCAVYVAQSSQAESVSTRGIDISIHGDVWTRRRHFEGLTNLSVQLEVGYGAPVFRGRLGGQQACERRF